MKYVDEYRDKKRCQKVADLIRRAAGDRTYKIMEVCGTHTASIRRFGLRALLPQGIELISGPGCPVCVTSEAYLENGLRLARMKDILLVTYPDMLRVPCGAGSLDKEKASGRDIRGVNSVLEGLEIARKAASKEVVFLGVGFETTAPGTAIAVEMAEKQKLKNFTVYSGHKTIPEALVMLSADPELRLDGFLLPGHVSVILGEDGYRKIMPRLRKPSCIAGFEPLDILVAVHQIVEAVNKKEVVLDNEYTRIVSHKGNLRARSLLNKVFTEAESLWRGLGVIPKSGLFLRKKYQRFDASWKFSLPVEKEVRHLTGCLCADVLKGKITPEKCRFFGKTCQPLSPLGPCMVSREGTCRSYFEYR